MPASPCSATSASISGRFCNLMRLARTCTGTWRLPSVRTRRATAAKSLARTSITGSMSATTSASLPSSSTRRSSVRRHGGAGKSNSIHVPLPPNTKPCCLHRSSNFSSSVSTTSPSGALSGALLDARFGPSLATTFCARGTVRTRWSAVGRALAAPFERQDVAVRWRRGTAGCFGGLVLPPGPLALGVRLGVTAHVAAMG
jgi:hypothetical protein